jgi:group I intron endonuclease
MLNEPGIYRIVNSVNKKTYIGHSMDVKDRLKKHLVQLRKGGHINKRLQNDFNAFGEVVFVFEAIEYCDPTVLKRRESNYIYEWGTLDEAIGYNIMPTAKYYLLPLEKVEELMITILKPFIESHIDAINKHYSKRENLYLNRVELTYETVSQLTGLNNEEVHVLFCSIYDNGDYERIINVSIKFPTMNFNKNKVYLKPLDILDQLLEENDFYL